MKGYKGMTKDMTCLGMKFEIGQSYHIDGEITICRNGLHFCKQLIDTMVFYNNDGNNRYFEIEANGIIKTKGRKSVTSSLTIVREIKGVELNRIIYGYRNANSLAYGDGYGNGLYYTDENGNGYGNGYSYGRGDGYGYGNGYGNGYGYGDGNGYSYGRGNGYGDGYGDGNGNRSSFNFNGGHGHNDIQTIVNYL